MYTVIICRILSLLNLHSWPSGADSPGESHQVSHPAGSEAAGPSVPVHHQDSQSAAGCSGKPLHPRTASGQEPRTGSKKKKNVNKQTGFIFRLNRVM